MCDINKISQEKNNMINSINNTMVASGAIIVQVEKEMKAIEQKTKENIQKLSFLL